MAGLRIFFGICFVVVASAAVYFVRNRKKILSATTTSLIDAAASPLRFRAARYSLITGCVTSPTAVIFFADEHHSANSVNDRRVESW